MIRKILLLFVIVGIVAAKDFFFEAFDSVEAARYVERYSNGDTDLYESLKDGCGNWKNLAAVFDELPSEFHDDAIWLINKMEHLDRLLMEKEILIEHIIYSRKIEEFVDYKIPDSLYRPFILTYRVSYEPITMWRRLLMAHFLPMLQNRDDIFGIASYVNRWVADSLSEVEYNFFGGMQAPDMTLRRKKGTASEISAFTCSVLKSLGIPARTAYMEAQGFHSDGRSWLEFYDGTRWLPIFTDKPDKIGDYKYLEEFSDHNVTFAFARGGFSIEEVTEKYSDVGIIKVRFFLRDEPAVGFRNFSVEVINNGAIVPLDYAGGESDSLGIFIGQLGDGDYLLTVGLRDHLGNPNVKLHAFHIAPNETTYLELEVTPPTRIAKVAQKATWQKTVLQNKDGEKTADYLHNDRINIIFIFDRHGEPSLRMMKLMNQFSEKNKELRLSGISVNESPTDQGDDEYLIDNLYDVDCSLAKRFDYSSCDDFIKSLPMVILLRENDMEHYEIISQGFDMNIIDKIEGYMEKE